MIPKLKCPFLEQNGWEISPVSSGPLLTRMLFRRTLWKGLRAACLFCVVPNFTLPGLWLDASIPLHTNCLALNN